MALQREIAPAHHHCYTRSINKTSLNVIEYAFGPLKMALYNSIIPDILDIASLPDNPRPAIGIKRRHSHDTGGKSEKKVKSEM